MKSLSDVPAMGDDGAKNLHQTQNHNDTGANGNTEVSYTWELGNGMALHVGAGERRVKPFTNLSTAAWTGVANPTSSIAGQQAPNPYVAFKVSQAMAIKRCICGLIPVLRATRRLTPADSHRNFQSGPAA